MLVTFPAITLAFLDLKNNALSSSGRDHTGFLITSVIIIIYAFQSNSKVIIKLLFLSNSNKDNVRFPNAI